MSGDLEIKLSQEAMVEIVQHYFDNEVFDSGHAPDVQNVEVAPGQIFGGPAAFVVRTKERIEEDK